tara:strand:- start:944 stop:1564 length:621 start_codon:yes stop_codon:yes gene_type:complete
MSYLKSKDGSIEASIKEMQKNLNDNAYQKLFKKELEKTGKGIGSMSDMEKKDFFNKLDKMYKGKDEAKVDELTKAQEKLPPALQKAIKAKEKNEDLDNKDSSTVKDVVKQLKKAVKAHSGQAKDLEKAMKSEEESFDIEKLKEDVNTLWSTAANDLEEMKKNAKYMKAQDVAPDSDTESDKEKKGKTLVGSAKTKIETEPKIDYQK